MAFSRVASPRKVNFMPRLRQRAETSPKSTSSTVTPVLSSLSYESTREFMESISDLSSLPPRRDMVYFKSWHFMLSSSALVILDSYCRSFSCNTRCNTALSSLDSTDTRRTYWTISANSVQVIAYSDVPIVANTSPRGAKRFMTIHIATVPTDSAIKRTSVLR